MRAIWAVSVFTVIVVSVILSGMFVNIDFDVWAQGTTVDLAIFSSFSSSPIVPGNTFDYSFTVFHLQPINAENVVVTSILPAEVTFVSATSTQGTCSETGGVVTCNLGIVFGVLRPSDGGPEVTITVTVDPSTTENFFFEASVTSDTFDDRLSNNIVRVISRIATADLAISKTASPDPVIAGSQLTYTLDVFNPGPETAENVVVTDTLPAGVTFDSATSTQTICLQRIVGVVTCGFSSIVPVFVQVPPGQNPPPIPDATITITVNVNANTIGIISNTASITSSTKDPVSSNDSTTTQTEVFTTIIDSPTEDNVNINPGESGIISDDVDGNVQVDDGRLTITGGSTIGGNVEVTGGSTVTIEDGSTINGNIIISGAGSVIEIINADIQGNIESQNIDSVTIIDSIINGNINSDNDGVVIITGNTVNGSIDIINPTVSCSESGNSVNGNNSSCPP